MKNEKLTIYRILILEHEHAPIDVDRLISQSWSEDVSGLEVSALKEPNIHGGVDVCLCAEVAPQDVDWAATRNARAMIPWEMEILLLPEADLKNLRLHRFCRYDGLGAEITDHPSLVAARSQSDVYPGRSGII